MSDGSFREIQLTAKQVVFLFMAGLVAAVGIFLLGVQVGQRVSPDAPPAEATSASDSADGAPDVMPPATTPRPGELTAPNDLQNRHEPHGIERRSPGGPRHKHREDAHEHRQPERQTGGQEAGDDDRQPAELGHHLREPVERPAEVHGSGEPAVAEDAHEGHAVARGEHGRDDEWRERHPRQSRMPEFRKAQGEEQTREER